MILVSQFSRSIEATRAVSRCKARGEAERGMLAERQQCPSRGSQRPECGDRLTCPHPLS